VEIMDRSRINYLAKEELVEESDKKIEQKIDT
jgi:hypothetical protein